jgi:hypothetical protein
MSPPTMTASGGRSGGLGRRWHCCNSGMLAAGGLGLDTSDSVNTRRCWHDTSAGLRVAATVLYRGCMSDINIKVMNIEY